MNKVRTYRGRSQTATSCRADATEGFLNSLADPNGELAREWDMDHDRHVFQKLLAIVQPDFSGTTWEAFRRFASTVCSGGRQWPRKWGSARTPCFRRSREYSRGYGRKRASFSLEDVLHFTVGLVLEARHWAHDASSGDERRIGLAAIVDVVVATILVEHGLKIQKRLPIRNPEIVRLIELAQLQAFRSGEQPFFRLSCFLAAGHAMLRRLFDS